MGSEAPDLIYITEGLSMKPDYPWGLWHAIPPKPDLPTYRRPPWLPEDLVERIEHLLHMIDVAPNPIAHQPHYEQTLRDILNAVKGEKDAGAS